MFFRRTQPKELTFDERLERVRRAGFKIEPLAGGHFRISRDGCAAIGEHAAGGPARVIERAGILMDGEIGALVDGGFQKFFRTPGGKSKPALAGELKTLHEFEEDLREALGQTSLYNEALGTVSTFYLYDRVQNRDRGVPKRVWE
jgi:hypothetical protein